MEKILSDPNRSLEMKTVMCEVDNILSGIYSRLDVAGENISKLKNTAIKTTFKKHRKKRINVMKTHQ